MEECDRCACGELLPRSHFQVHIRTCPEHLQAVEKAETRERARREQIREEYGDSARHVDYYKPSRKQKRAQAAAKRRQAAKRRKP